MMARQPAAARVEEAVGPIVAHQPAAARVEEAVAAADQSLLAGVDKATQKRILDVAVDKAKRKIVSDFILKVQGTVSWRRLVGH